MIRVVVITAEIVVAVYGTAYALIGVSVCIVRAVDNAKKRKVRRQMRAELEAQLEQDIYDREFAEIARHWKTDA